MKKIIIIDGGPRKNMNTAKLLQRFAEGAKSAGSDVEVKTIRLYDLDYKGCMSSSKARHRTSAVSRMH
jgi:multimeric flavodoxin WrbA